MFLGLFPNKKDIAALIYTFRLTVLAILQQMIPVILVVQNLATLIYLILTIDEETR